MRRAFVFGGAALISGIAINEMRLVLNVGGLTILEIVVLVLFALNTIWISLSVPMAIAGFVRLAVPALPHGRSGCRSPAGRRS